MKISTQLICLASLVLGACSPQEEIRIERSVSDPPGHEAPRVTREGNQIQDDIESPIIATPRTGANHADMMAKIRGGTIGVREFEGFLATLTTREDLVAVVKEVHATMLRESQRILSGESDLRPGTAAMREYNNRWRSIVNAALKKEVEFD